MLRFSFIVILLLAFTPKVYSQSITMNCFSKHSIDINWRGEKWNESHDCFGMNFGNFHNEKFALYLKDSYNQPSLILGVNHLWSLNGTFHIGGAAATIYRENDGLEPLILPLVSIGNDAYAVNFTYKPEEINMDEIGEPVSVLFMSMRFGLN